jgi:hypothetical protein
MPKIFAACLVTGQPIDTHIEIDDASFARNPEELRHCAAPRG